MVTMMTIYGFIGGLITIGLFLKELSKKWLVGIILGLILVSCIVTEAIQQLSWK